MTFDKLWQTAWKDGELDASKPREKTTTKLKVDHGDCKTETAFSNEKFSLKADAVLLSKDGYKSTLLTTLEAKYLKETWKASGVLSLVTPDLGGAKVNTQVRRIPQNLISETCIVANFERNYASKLTNYTHALFYFLVRRRSRELGCQEQQKTTKSRRKG